MTKSVVVSMIALGLLFPLRNVAQAFPASAVGTGNSCSSCHSSDGGSNPVNPTGDPASDREDALEVLGGTLLDLGNGNRNDGKDRGELPAFTVEPGNTIDLTMQALDGTDLYAVQLKRLEKAAVLGPAGADFLTGYLGDAGWVAQGPSPATYFTNTSFSIAWPENPPNGPDSISFSLTVSPDTPPNTYDLEYAIAGRLGADSGRLRWYDDQHFYLQVVPEPSTLAMLAVAAGFGIFYVRRRN